jgi:hypothetical protein
MSYWMSAAWIVPPLSDRTMGTGRFPRFMENSMAIQSIPIFRKLKKNLESGVTVRAALGISRGVFVGGNLWS